MSKIRSCVENIQDIEITVFITMTAGEWKELTRKLDDANISYYGPINDTISEIKVR